MACSPRRDLAWLSPSPRGLSPHETWHLPLGRRADTLWPIRSLAKLAFASDAKVEMTYKQSILGKQEFHLKLSPNDAKQIQHVARTKEPKQKIAQLKENPVKPALHPLASSRSREMTDAIVRLSKQEGSQFSDLQALIETLVETLGAHHSEYIFEIASGLEVQGQHLVAEMLRDA
jgi:sugar diacid utilization regulator